MADVGFTAIGIIFVVLAWLFLIAMLLVLLIVAMLLLILLKYWITGLVLHLAAWRCWCQRGCCVMFVYSESPKWQGYVDANILPRLGDRAIVLNWSHRHRWRRSLATRLFWYFAGDHDVNPLALVFRPFRKTRQFRFYQPFRDFKHGKTEPLAELERALFEYVDEVSGRSRSRQK